MIEALCSFPLIGIGLFTPIKRPILGGCLGVIGFVAIIWWYIVVSGSMSV